jgi:hypothetical protein
MHIAIDDTYGPTGPTRSKYLTGARRTHVAVVFSDDEVEEVRKQIRSCLDFIGELLPRPKEFHFVDIYNGNGHWAPLKDGRNIHLIEAFCSIYSNYRWPVMLQTIDDRTFRDHGIKEFRGIIDGLNLSDRHDMSLLMLCIKIKKKMNHSASPLTLIVDEGKKKSNRKFGQTLFRDWKGQYRGYYASSSEEPLLQIADLLAFCTNRITHLSTKEKRTETDEEFIRIVSGMRIRSEDISPMVLPRDFTVEDIDRFHAMDRLSKGLKD